MRRAFLITCFVLSASSLYAACGGCDETGDGGGLVLADELSLSIEPEVLNFGTVNVGEVVERSVRIKHVGQAGRILLDIGLETESQDFELQPVLLDALDAGQSIDVTVRYAPTDALSDTGSLRVGTNIAIQGGATLQVDVPLLTLAQVASLVPTPGTVDFGSVPTGTSSEKVLELRNLGGFDLVLTAAQLQTTVTSDVTVAAPEGGFPLTLAPNDLVSIPLSYTPTGRNVDNEVLEIRFNGLDGDGQLEVPVVGAEVTAQLVANPNPVDFGLQFPGLAATQPVAITNNGSYTLEIASVAVSGEGPYAGSVGLSDGPSVPLRIEPGETLDSAFVVTFTPDPEMEPSGQALAYVDLQTNDPTDGGVQRIAVFGQRRGTGLEVYPPDIAYFGFVNQGGESLRTITLYNAASSDIEVASVVIEGGFSMVAPEQWSFTAEGGASPYTLSPGASIEVGVVFANEPGDWPPGMTAWGKFIIESNDPQNNPWTVLLNAQAGDAEPCALQMVPDSLDLGFVSSETQAYGAFDIVNIGKNDCTWVGAAIDDCEPLVGCELPTTDAPPTASSSTSWAIAGEPDAGTLIAPGDSLPLLVRFDAPVVDSNQVFDFVARLTAWVSFADPNSGQQVFTRLHGESWGSGPNAKARVSLGQLLVTPPILDFGVTPVGCRSQPLTATAQNIGAGPVVITDFELSGCGLEYKLEGFPPLTEALEDGSFGLTLQAGQSVEFTISYAPQDDTTDACQLRISHDRANEPEVAELLATGTYEDSQTDYFYDSEAQKVDVLFVVDDSGSMGQEQENLATSFQAFIEEAAKWQSDYHIGVTTTTVQFPVGGDLRGSPAFVSNKNWEKFLPNVLVGTQGSGEEQGLWAAKIALSPPLTDETDETCQSDNDCSNLFHVCNAGKCGGANMGFLRPDAALEIIFVSDEDDQSPESLDDYLSFFASLKGVDKPDQFHIHSIVGPYGDCQSDNGTAWAGNRYLALTEDTGGVDFSICELDFAKGLEDIGEIAFSSKMKYFLTNYPAPTTIQVFVNDIPCPLTSGGLFNWKYDNAGNSVTLLDGGICRAAPGDEVKIQYELLCYDTP